MKRLDSRLVDAGFIGAFTYITLPLDASGFAGIPSSDTPPVFRAESRMQQSIHLVRRCCNLIRKVAKKGSEFSFSQDSQRAADKQAAVDSLQPMRGLVAAATLCDQD